MMSNRMLSTYVNALAKTGFIIERMLEESDDACIQSQAGSAFAEKARVLPVTIMLKARKL